MIIYPGQSTVVERLAVLGDGIRKATQQGSPVLVSYSEPTWAIDPIDVYAQAATLVIDQVTDRFFWSQPNESFTLVGLGIAQMISAVEDSRFRQAGKFWQHLLTGAVRGGLRGLSGVGPLLFGGFAFDPQRSKSRLWEGYQNGRMVLPQLLYTVQHGEAWLTYNVIVTPDSDPDLEADRLSMLTDKLMQADGLSRYHEPVSSTLHELRPAADWQADVARTAQDIAEGKLEKAVLARAVRLEAEQPFDTAEALRRLSANYRDCYIFAVANEDRCFLGATPERLASVSDGTIKTTSLAGSIRRGATIAEDQELGETLLNSAKDHQEHQVVVQFLVESLNQFCDQLNVGATPTLLKLGNVQHLCTPITGHLKGHYTLFDVLERLHPTPAVGGRPREVAFDLIREREGLDRGWYAGPIGWIDQNGEGEFAVAIRSALVDGAEATLFAGCGIVATSDPEREYAESCLKLKPMLAALTD